MIYCAGTQIDRALSHYRECVEHLAYHPELALEIAKLLLQLQQAEKALPFLESALQDDATRTAGHFYLGCIYREQGEQKRALAHLDTAREKAPAWEEILITLAETHQRLGNRQRSQALLDECNRQRLQATQLLRQLAGGAHPAT